MYGPGLRRALRGFTARCSTLPRMSSRTAPARKRAQASGKNRPTPFRETDAPERPFDGHHVQIYTADFSGPHGRLLELGLITEESDEYQYRFKDLIDRDGGEVLFTIEHETRSQTNPMYGRPLVNRNPAQTNTNYKPGHDSLSWALP